MTSKIKRYLYILLLILIWDPLNAQESLLIGKWRLVEMQQDSIIIFDWDSAEIIIEEAHERQIPLDSVELNKYIQTTHLLMKKLYFEFLGKGKFKASVLDLNEGIYSIVEEQGGYFIDGNKIGISVSGGIDSYVYRIEGNKLTFIPIIDRNIYNRGYAKYEKLK